MTLHVSAHLVVKLKLKKAIKFRAGRMRFCWDLSLHLVVVCFLSSSLTVSQQQLYNLPAYASFPPRWNLSMDSDRAFNFRDRSFVLPILSTATHGFGFYSIGAKIPGNYYITVFILPCGTSFFDKRCPPQVVWSANRNSPVKIGSTLELNSDGDMVLKDADKTVVWSTNTSGKSVSGMNLTELGNLVLLDRNNASVWESFNHPTDSLVLGQKMVLGQKLTVSVSATNLYEFGSISLSMTRQGPVAHLETDPPQVYYQQNDKPIDYNFIYFKYIRGSLVSLYTDSLGISSYASALPIPAVDSTPQYIKLSSDGHLRAYEWDGNRWKEVADLLTEEAGDCGYPLVCGRYGICSNGLCSCPLSSSQTAYFKQINDTRPELGCSETLPLSCGDPRNASFLELPGIRYFDSGLELQNTTAETCKEACARNCSCKSAFFQSPTNNKYSKCSLQNEVFSLMSSEYGSIAYIKVHRGITARRQHANQLPVILGSSIGSFIILSGVLLFFIGKKKCATEMEEEHYLDQLPGMPTRFSYDDLKALTDNFSEKLGEGGFGSVFEGTLTDGMRVAVKHLHGLGQIKNSFLAEVKSIGSIHHINLVSLVGFCADKSHRLLVYEYMANGSLEKWVFHKNNKFVLNWQQRKKIILDIAKGLTYLHEECKQKIIHLDIKPQNILLDENLNAKISDFGLSKLVDRDKSQVVTTMRGTPGYLAPEWLNAVITEKVDVYSFGVVTLEILCGRKMFNISLDEEDRNLLCLFKRKAEEDQLLDMVDEYLDDLQLYGVEAVNMMKLAAWCLQADYTRRPSMSTVIKVLDGAMKVEDDLDYNFWTRPVRVGCRENAIGATAPPLPSILSGPR